MRSWQDKQNAGGQAPKGDSSALVTKDDADNIRHALPAGAGGIGARFRVPTVPARGLALDFDADDIVGVDGSTVSKWVDGSGFNVVAAAIGSPKLKTLANGINGHNVVRFDGGTPLGTAETCCFTAPLDPSGWAGMSVYYVARSGAGDPHNRYSGVFGWPQVPGSWFTANLGSATDGAGAGWGGATGGALFGDVSGFTPSTVYYQSYRYDKTQWRLDGARTATIADTAWPTAALTALIGSNSFPFSQSDIDLGRLLVYNRKLTDAEDAQVKAYLRWWAGLATAPGRELSVGYPETLTNFYAVRHVHPAGDDSSDGKTEQTAKFTLLAAWDDAVAELGARGVVVIYVHDESYIGGEVENNGLWLYHFGSAPGPGWRAYHPYRIIGVGGVSAGRGFTPCKARVYQGRPGDSQAFDLSKPLIWQTGGQLESTLRNFQPAGYGFARLGVQALPGNVTGTRDGNLENLWWTNVMMLSPPDTAPVYGPAYDCGWLSLCWFTFCQAFGSATMRPVTINSGVDFASGTTIHLSNVTFDATNDLNGYLTITGGPNQGQWFIDAILGPNDVTVHGPHALVAEFFNPAAETIEKAFGPAVLDDDNHAGWLFRPSPVIAGSPGSMGEVHFRWASTQQCGIKYYLGNEGEIGLFIRGFVSEGGPMPHPVQVRLMPGATIPSLNSSNTQIEIAERFLVADGFGLDQYYLYIDPQLHDSFGVGTIKVGDMQGGAVYGPCVWSGNDATAEGLTTTPTALRQYGWFRNGKLTGKHDAAARLGLPGTALPSSTGSVGNHVTNILSHDPTAWTGPALHYTAGIADVFGLSNAGRMDALSSGTLAIPQSTVAPATTTVATGDFIVAGVWIRAVDGPNTALATITATGVGAPTLPNLPLQPTWRGNKQWEFFRAYGTVTAGGTGAFSMSINATSLSALDVAYPVLEILKVADGFTKEEAAARADTLHTWNPLLAQGSAGTLRNQPFVASGGIGVASTVPQAVSAGTTSVTKTVALFSDDGRTTQGYLPLLPTNQGLPAGTVTSVGATSPVTSSGGTTPTIGINDFVASGGSHARGAVPDPGAVAGSTKFLREDATWQVPPGSVNSVGATAPITSTGGASPVIGINNFVGSGASHASGAVPDPGSTAGNTKFLREDATWQAPTGDHKVISTSSDSSPDYLSNKIVSAGNTVQVGTVGGGVQVTLDVNVFAGSGVGHAVGLVPDPGAVAGTAKYLREDSSFHAIQTERSVSYYLNGIDPITTPGYMATSVNSTLIGATNIAYPLGVAASSVRLQIWVLANNISTSGGTGLMSFQVYRTTSGGAVTLITSVTALTTVAAGTLIDTGYFTSVGTTAATDMWSARHSSTGTYVSGTISYTAVLVVGYVSV